MKNKFLYGIFLFLIVGILMLIQKNTTTETISKSGNEINHMPTLIKSDDFNSGIGGYDEGLIMIRGGKEIIRFLLSDKRIIGMDGRTIGYLSDEEAKLLQNFLGGER